VAQEEEALAAETPQRPREPSGKTPHGKEHKAVRRTTRECGSKLARAEGVGKSLWLSIVRDDSSREGPAPAEATREERSAGGNKENK
jgi:hypothetical protein